MPQRTTALVLCTGNSCRSQMAEALLRKHAGGWLDAYSAGLNPRAKIHPLAVQVMEEIGVDLSEQFPKGVEKYLGRISVSHLIVVCSQVEQDCPRLFPGAMNRLFWPFDDPAAASGSRAQRLEVFRTVRDQINERIQAWLPEAEKAGHASLRRRA